MPLYVQLPANQCREVLNDGRSVYYTDYCRRNKSKKLPKQSLVKYSSFIDTRTAKEKLLLDHYNTFPVNSFKHKSLCHHRHNYPKNEKLKGEVMKGEQKTIVNLAKQCDELLRETAPEVLENIETALLKNNWTSPTTTGDTTKREAIRGVTGKKMEVHQKPKKENLPGFNDWIQTSDDYDKQVVHKFLSNLTTANPDERQQTPANQNDRQQTPTNQVGEGRKTVRITSPPKSAPTLLSRRIKTGDSTTCEDVQDVEESVVMLNGSVGGSRASSRSSSTSSADGRVKLMNISTQIPHEPNSKPSSPQYVIDKPLTSSGRHNRAKTAPGLHHSCQYCEACKQRVYMRMIRDLEKSKMAEIEPKVQTCIYRPEEDYMHAGTSFQRVNGRRKGYFTIHPDFVSENQNTAWKKWKVNEKYFGESKSLF